MMYYRGGSYWKTTPAIRDAVLELYLAGWPIKEIAHRLGISDSYVTALAKKAGLALRHPVKQTR